MNPSQLTKEQITSICSAVAVKVWEKFFEIRDTFGEKELEKYETVDELPDDANNPIRQVDPGCVKENAWGLNPCGRSTHWKPGKNRNTSKALSIRSLEIDESILAYFKLCEYVLTLSCINDIQWYDNYNSKLSFHPLFNYNWLEEKTFTNLINHPSYKPEKTKIEQYIHFMRTMASYGLIVIAFSPGSIIPVETGDIMLHPKWREYLENEERKEAEIERSKLEKKGREERDRFIQELNERLEYARIEAQKLRQVRIESESQSQTESQNIHTRSRKEGVIGFFILLLFLIFVLYSLFQTKARYLELPMC